MIYAGKELTATVTGGRIETVVCEKCRTRFFYELTRLATGKASAPYFMFQGAAANRAEARAQRALAKRLERDAELVPCPKCQWVNQDLVDRYRRGLYPRAGWLAAAIFFGSFAAGPVFVGLLSEVVRAGQSTVMIALPLAWLAGLVATAMVFVVRRQLRLKVDPNRLHPRPPSVPPGTPPAMVEEKDVRTGETHLRAVPRPIDPQAVGADEWVVLRPGQLRLPQNCCVCLERPQTIYRAPVRVNSNDEGVPVPLCDACASRLTLRWLLIAFVTAAGVLGVASLLAVGLPFGDPLGRWMAFGGIGAITAIVAAVLVPNRFCRPYQVRLVDAARGIYQFRAKNPQFTALVDGLARKAEAGGPPPMPTKRPRVQPVEVDRGAIPLE